MITKWRKDKVEEMKNTIKRERKKKRKRKYEKEKEGDEDDKIRSVIIRGKGIRC